MMHVNNFVNIHLKSRDMFPHFNGRRPLKTEARGSSATVVFNYETARRQLADSDLFVYTHTKIVYIQFPQLQLE
jgi:hypothetical protein